jgi:hypothetical protein
VRWRYDVRSMIPRTVLTSPTQITLSAVILLGASLSIHWFGTSAWLSEFLMNLGFLAIGLTAAYGIGERLIERSERRRWMSVERAIELRVLRAALAVMSGFVDSPTIRAQLTQRDDPIPSYQEMMGDPKRAHAFARDSLLPVTKKYTGLRPPPNMTLDFHRTQ